MDVWEGQLKAVRSAAAWVKDGGPAGQVTAAHRFPRAYYGARGAERRLDEIYFTCAESR